jgi:manganese/zinc/iron transport system substrate-binding protein
MKKILIMLLCFLALACGNEEKTSQEDGKASIVATTGMVADLVKNIGKDSVEVTALMGPGVDPHLYKATQGDLRALQGADIIFYNGLHLEGKMGEVFEKLGRIKKVVPVAGAIEESRLLQDPTYSGAADPHIWFDVSLWVSTVDVVARTLSEADPGQADYYRQNAAAYKDTLSSLHEWVKKEIQKIPEGRRILITAHDAFNYFGRAYGMEVRGLQGISTLSEFGLKDRVDLVDFIVENGIKAVFVETSVSEKNINSIVEGASKKGHAVSIGGNLYSDAMGKAGTAEGTYVGMVRANIRTIVESLK